MRQFFFLALAFSACTLGSSTGNLGGNADNPADPGDTPIEEPGNDIECPFNEPGCLPDADFHCEGTWNLYDGPEHDIFCDDRNSGCYYIDFESDGTVDQQACDQVNLPRCVGVDEDQDGIVDRQDCNVDAMGDCIMSTFNDDGIPDFMYCPALCGCVFVDIDGDCQVEGGTICDTSGRNCPTSEVGEDCSPTDLNLDDQFDSFYCESGCTLVDLDGDGVIDEENCDITPANDCNDNNKPI